MTAAEMPAGVAAAIDGYTSAWSAGDLQRVADLWAHEENLSYVAEELSEILTDRDRIVQHLLQTEHRLAQSTVSVKDLAVQRLDEHLALATFICRWELDCTSYSRVAVILRPKDSRWRFIHYMESPFHLENWD